MPTVVLYSKAGCCLCDEARAHLEEVAAETEFDLREIDIRRDPELFDRYRYRIPVIVIDAEERLEGRIEACDVRRLLLPH
jgi:glutaredoxin